MSKVTVDFNKKHQTVESFGGSAAWWSQVVGNFEISDKIAELLYSKEKGIGLGVYRYNLGAGTMKNGESPFWSWEHATEKVENDTNSVSMMQKSVNAGAEEITVFVNSPPVELTVNGKGRCEKAMHSNIKPKNYRAFANYCLDACEYLLNMGLPVKYLSPINEPAWTWNNDKQEGCFYLPHQVKKVFKVFAEELEKREHLKGKLLLAGTECADLRWLNKSYSRAMLNCKVTRRNIDSVDYHAYWLNPVKPFFSDRVAYLKRYRKFHDRWYKGTKIKMTEWCHMQGGTDCSMNSGIVVANTIYEDLKYADVVSWQHWVLVAFGGYCDGIIYVDTEKQTYELTKRYFVTGNFSKFLVGATRVEAECDNSDINCLCFTRENEIIYILINNSENEQITCLPHSGFAKMHVTDSDNDLSEKDITDASSIPLSPKSVNTVVINE